MEGVSDGSAYDQLGAVADAARTPPEWLVLFIICVGVLNGKCIIVRAPV